MSDARRMPTFWELLTAVKDEHGSTEAWVLRQSELSHGQFNAWRNRGIPVLPPRRNLLLMAHAMKVDYEYLIQVILHTAEYLPLEAAVEATKAGNQYMNRSRTADELEVEPSEAETVKVVAFGSFQKKATTGTRKARAARTTGKATASQRDKAKQPDDDFEPR